MMSDIVESNKCNVIDDNKIVKEELFDINAMEGLASHDGVSVDVKKLLKAYKRKRENGNTVQIIYEYGKTMKNLKRGRMYPQKGVGLQSFPSDVRCALAQKYYFDIDMVNSQPVILSQICEKNGWKCDKLKEYVSNRSAVLLDIMDALGCDRDDAKNVCIATMFGATYKKSPIFIKELAVELQLIATNLVNTNQDLLKICQKEKNPASSVVAHICQDIEFQILQTIDMVMKQNGRRLDVYIHDGGLVRKLDGEIEFPSVLLRNAESEIKNRLGFDITLAVKPMVHLFEFKKDIMRMGVVSEREYQARKELFEETHFYSVETETVCTITPRGLTHISKSSANVSFASYNFHKIVNNKVRISEFIPEWLKDPTKRSIEKLIFYPSISYEVSEDSYNTFNGLIGSQYNGEITEREKIIERYKELVNLNAGKNEVMYDYMLKWFASSVQKPFQVPGVAIVLINTLQGTGKETLAEFHGSKVIGNDYYKNIKNVETELFDKHSTAFDRTLFMKLEEVNGSLNRKYSDMLKAMITSTSSTINPKGMKKYVIDAFPHIIMTTNNAVPVKVEPSDRRFCISYTSSERLGDTAFWNETYYLFGLPEAGAVVFQYLNSIDLSNFDVHLFPRSEYHKALAETEIPSEVQFINQCDSFTDLKATVIHTQYVLFCNENHITPKSIVHFSRSLTPLVENKLLIKRTNDGYTLYSKT